MNVKTTKKPVKLTWANVNYQYERGCKNKRRYKKKKNAINDLKRIKKQGYIISGNPCVYKCTFCGGWHLGHSKW